MSKKNNVAKVSLKDIPDHVSKATEAMFSTFTNSLTEDGKSYDTVTSENMKYHNNQFNVYSEALKTEQNKPSEEQNPEIITEALRGMFHESEAEDEAKRDSCTSHDKRIDAKVVGIAVITTVVSKVIIDNGPKALNYLKKTLPDIYKITKK